MDLVGSWTVDICMLSFLPSAEQRYTCRLSYVFFVTDSWPSVHLHTFVCFLCYQQLNSCTPADFHMFSLLPTADRQCTCTLSCAFFVTNSWTEVHLQTFLWLLVESFRWTYYEINFSSDINLFGFSFKFLFSKLPGSDVRLHLFPTQWEMDFVPDEEAAGAWCWPFTSA